ncbi:MAG TPA: fructose-bisphosphatase class II, partial [Magnetospirillum sp.]|nr:fructose-bisphosphatase class II [Magnetospirillum sp.]
MPNRIFVPPPQALDRNLALEVVRVTEASALAAGRWVGRGDEKAADEAATAAMREALNSLAMEGVIVNGDADDAT